MAELNSDTTLQLAPSLTVQLGAQKVIHIGGQRLNAPANILSILEAFSNPVQYSVAVKNLTARVSGAQAWIELVSNIRALHQAGVLVDETGSVPVPAVGWAAPQIHIAMLNDQPRTAAFIGAINETVREGDVVLDIGTGTGVLALAAARAGARHVYAVEASHIGQAAKELFAANGFADRITLVPGWSSQIELPEKANVLVAEIIGNDPLEEGIMETFSDARRRLLTPDARIIPSRVQSFGVPVEVDEDVYRRMVFTPESTRAWRELYGFDFAGLLDASVNKSIPARLNPYEIRGWPQLSEPVLLSDLDLSGETTPRVNESTTFTIRKDGTMNGFFLYWNLTVSQNRHLTTATDKAEEKCNWALRAWLPGSPTRVKKGDRFNVTYSYRVDSSQTSVDIVPA
jgi:protein arginine N-methyltransferase 1